MLQSLALTCGVVSYWPLAPFKPKEPQTIDSPIFASSTPLHPPDPGSTPTSPPLLFSQLFPMNVRPASEVLAWLTVHLPLFSLKKGHRNMGIVSCCSKNWANTIKVPLQGIPQGRSI